MLKNVQSIYVPLLHREAQRNNENFLMIHKFNFLVLGGGNLVLSDNSNILSNTLLISLSDIVLNEKDISPIFAPEITINYFETL